MQNSSYSSCMLSRGTHACIHAACITVYHAIDAHPQTAARAVLSDDAQMTGIYARADEPVDVVVRKFLHQIKFFFDGARHLHTKTMRFRRSIDRSIDGELINREIEGTDERSIGRYARAFGDPGSTRCRDCASMRRKCVVKLGRSVSQTNGTL